MKKIFTIILLLSNLILASTGWYSDYVKINKNNTGDTYYWIGSDPGFGTQFQNANLGTVSTMLIGADMRYWSDTQDRTGGAFYWEIMDNTNTTIISGPFEAIWNQSSLGGNDYQGLYSVNINVLSGLSGSTSYKLRIWAKHWGSGQGDNWLNNSGSDYVASFTTDSSVPVELKAFLATAGGKEIKLNWQTATEINNYGFEVEKRQTSSVKSETWKNIGFVNGHGNSNSPKNYSFTDEDVLSGKYFYRLKQIDNDGKYEYSKEVEVNVESAPTEFGLFQNYPNPFNPSTTIKYALPNKEFVQLKVFNILGNEIATLVNEVQEAGSYKVEFNLTNIKNPTSGIYFYRLEAGAFVESRKMTLLK